MTGELSFQVGVRVWHPEDFFYWIDASTFAISEAARSMSPAELLLALLRDEHYVNVYYTADDSPAARDDAIRARANGQPVDPSSLAGYYVANASRERYQPTATHGPYLLSHIIPEAFESIRAEVGRSRLIEWLEDDGQSSCHHRTSETLGSQRSWKRRRAQTPPSG